MSTLLLSALLAASLAAHVAVALAARRARRAAVPDARLVGSEERLALALETAAMGWFLFGPRGVVWSDGLGPLWGMPRGFQPPDFAFIAERVHPDDREHMMGNVARALATGEGYTSTYRIRHAAGHWVWFTTVGRVVGEGRGAEAQLMGVVRDVTREQELLREREDARDHLEAVIQSSADGVVTWDRALRITGWSRAMEEHTRKPASEVVGRVATEVFPSLLTNARGPAHHAALRGETVHLVDLPFVMRATGREGWTDESYAPIRGADGEVVGGIALVRDVTGRRLAQLQVEVARRAAEEASRAKSDFLARMSHELRTPLTAIIGFSNYLLRVQRDDPAIAPAQRDYLGRIAANGRHLLGLINDILDLSRIEAGRTEVVLAPVALDALVLDVVQLLEGEARAGVALVAELPPVVRPHESDDGKLRQVLINLVGNALKFTHAGRVTVRLECDAAGRPLALEVQDTGIGIAPGRRAAVFEAFEQADTSTTRQYGGTGLGLSISRALCTMLGATLTLESEVGVGTTFRVGFAPAAAAA